VSQSIPLTGSTTNLSNSSGPQTFSPVQQNVAPKKTIVSGGDAGPLTPTPNTSTPRNQQSSATLPSLRTNPITNSKPLGTKPTSRPTSTGSGTPSQTGDSLQGAVTNVKKAIGSRTGGPKQRNVDEQHVRRTPHLHRRRPQYCWFAKKDTVRQTSAGRACPHRLTRDPLTGTSSPTSSPARSAALQFGVIIAAGQTHGGGQQVPLCLTRVAIIVTTGGHLDGFPTAWGCRAALHLAGVP